MKRRSRLSTPNSGTVVAVALVLAVGYFVRFLSDAATGQVIYLLQPQTLLCGRIYSIAVAFGPMLIFWTFGYMPSSRCNHRCLSIDHTFG
mmetsp:Transcript_16445/g.24337  ORF Transcript_16445/g.24337 Transcript_16445/m.24337 type:complete len:90 (+) Transcript_16445:567-836(+)